MLTAWKGEKKPTSLHKEMPLFRHFLFSESSASSRCCSLRAQRRARRLSSASGPGHPVSVLCCLSVLSSSSNERCLKPRAGCWKDNISRGWCRGAQGSALPLLPIGTGAAVLRQGGLGQPWGWMCLVRGHVGGSETSTLKPVFPVPVRESSVFVQKEA